MLALTFEHLHRADDVISRSSANILPTREQVIYIRADSGGVSITHTKLARGA